MLTKLMDNIRQERSHPLVTLTAALVCLCALCGGISASAAPQTYGTLLSYDFDTKAWTGAATAAVGTIDIAGSTQPSLGLRSSSAIASGPLPINITETNLGKLTLAFSLSASAAKPVTVTVESYDASKNRTGGLQTLIYPAAPDFYQRYALDLSTCQPSGMGTFQPNAPYVSFSFSIGGTDWQGVTTPEIRLDNVHYALPAYYVSLTGSDKNDGHSEAKAFVTPQKGLNVAQPGDIVDVMSGTYIGPFGPSTSPPSSGGLSSVAAFTRAGLPAAWIVLKNYPGQMPTFFSNAWNIVNISQGSNGNLSSVPLAYLEVRGIHIRGEGDVIAQKYPDSIGQVDSRSNSNGIAMDGRYMTNLPHHIRIANNLIEYCPGGGIGTGEGDWITIENNVCRSNCWTTIYAPSGISLAGASNFDATDNVYKDLVRNNVCYRNQTYQPWAATKKISDGNGIILDVNQYTSTNPTGIYLGRTLVQSNLSFDNGGGGVHDFRASRVDIINNTAYLNSASPALQYEEIDASGANDVHIYNNILVAPVANTSAGEPAEPVNGNYKSTNVVFSHNLYFGGNTAPVMGNGDVIADPQFVNPTRDATVADFHLKITSPARATGLLQTYSPFLDLDGTPRGATPDKGVYELTQTTSVLTSSANPSAAGASVTLMATVTGSTPTGTVAFIDGSTTLGTITVTNNVASFSTFLLAAGSHSLKATYSGDTANTPSTSSVLTQNVKAVPTANSQSATTLVNHAVSLTLSGVDTNTPPLALTYTVTSSPTHGALSGIAPNLTYTPNAGYVGSDSVTFTASNGFFTSSAASVSINVTLASVSGTVTLQSWTGTLPALTFTLTPTGSTGGSVIMQTITPASGGAFSLTNVSGGTYMLGIKGSKWLRKSLSVNTSNGNVSGLSFALLAGDINNDNTVNNTDYLMLRNAYGTIPGQTNWDARADLNGDNTVNNTDYLILRGNYGLSGN